MKTEKVILKSFQPQISKDKIKFLISEYFDNTALCISKNLTNYLITLLFML